MSKRCRLALLLCANAVTCVLFAQVTITEFPWEVDFSGSQPFTLVNGTQPNHWIWGSAAGNEAPCLHIGSDLASGNDYWVGIDPWSGPSALSRVYAYVDLAIPEFHHAIDLYFDVRVGGDNSDNLEVFILPVTALPLAGTNPSSLGPGVLQVGPSFQGIPEWESRHYSLSPQYAGQTIRLAFHWRNDWSGGVQPGAAVDNIRVTTSPCIAPFGAVLDDISSTTAMAHWQGISVAAAYHYELRTNGAPGSGTYGLYAAGTVGSEQVLLQGLMPGTLYRLYLRTDCSDSLTTWSPAYPFVTDPACGSAFVDPGGPTAPYGPLMDRTYVICPTGTANAVRVAFNNMSIGPGDRLEVYDGAEAVGAPKAVITSDAASTYVSDDHGGCLTFRFVSDGEWHGNGWYGTVSCGPRTGCTVWGVEVQQVDVDAVQVRWHCTGALMPFVLEHGDLGWTPGTYVWAGQVGSISFLDTAAAIITGLTPGGVHELEVRANCELDGEYGARSGPVRFQMAPVCGHGYTDPGGEQYDYPPYASKVETVCPDDPAYPVNLTFSTFRLEPWYDVLYVFDGPDLSSPIIPSGNPSPLTTPNHGPGGWWGLTDLPGPFISTHPSGCLTTAFISDNTVEFEGWMAEVECGPLGIAESGHGPAGLICVPDPVVRGELLTVRIPDASQGMHLFELFSASGRCLAHQLAIPDAPDGHSIRLPMVPAGLYTVKVTDPQGWVMHARIIIL